LKGRKTFGAKIGFLPISSKRKPLKKTKHLVFTCFFKGLQMVELKKRRGKWHSSNKQRFKMVYKETNNKM